MDQTKEEACRCKGKRSTTGDTRADAGGARADRDTGGGRADRDTRHRRSTRGRRLTI